ncbi:hypothetical protein KQI52_11715 [bacterium]|nr:hypothetical protein [bacterium]
MDQHTALFEHILSTHRYVERWSTKLLCLDYSSESPRKLIKMIKAVSGGLLENAEYISANYNEADVAATRLLKGTFDVQNFIASSMKYVQSSDVEQVPWSFIEPLKNTIKKLLGDDVDVLLTPQWEYNYSVYIQDIEKWFKRYVEDVMMIPKYRGNVDDLFVDLDKKFIMISFPSSQRLNPMQLACLSHEVAHLVVDKLYFDKNDTSFEDNYVSQIKSKLDPVYHSVAAKVWKRAVEELMSDYIGVKMWGPASALAMSSMALQYGYNTPKNRKDHGYPPWIYRIGIIKVAMGQVDDIKREIMESKTILNGAKMNKSIDSFIENYSIDIDETAFMEVVHDIFKGYDIEIIKDDSYLENDLSVKTAYSVMYDCLLEAISIFDKYISSNVWNIADVRNNLRYIILSLLNGVPPSSEELKRTSECSAVDLGMLLLSLWIVKITVTSPNVSKQVDNWNRLILWAMDAENIANRYFDTV